MKNTVAFPMHGCLKAATEHVRWYLGGRLGTVLQNVSWLFPKSLCRPVHDPSKMPKYVIVVNSSSEFDRLWNPRTLLETMTCTVTLQYITPKRMERHVPCKCLRVKSSVQI